MKSFKGFAIIALVCAASLTGCATAPGANGEGAQLSRVAIQVVTSAAVREVVTRDNATPAKAAERASRVVAIATTLQTLGEDALATLPQAVEALSPLLDKAGLDPFERQQADLLVQALVAAALERVKIEKGSTYATVNLVLTDVIRFASYYLEPAAPPG